MKLKPLAQSISLVLLTATASQAAEFRVLTQADTGGGTPSMVAAGVYEIDTLRSAIEQANDETSFVGPDVISFADGIFNNGAATIQVDATGDTFSNGGSVSNSGFGISSEITLNGPIVGNTLTLEAGSVRHFQVNDGGTLTINKLTLSGGEAPADPSGLGGSILVVENASLELNDSVVSNNVALTGGAINFRELSNSSSINNSLLSNNSTTGTSGAGTGGAVFKRSDNPLYVNHSTFSNNTANYAGGALFTSGNLVVYASTIHNNFANRGGGGIATNNIGVLTLLNSTVSGNTANTNGGGVAIGTDSGYSLIVNSTLVGNHSDADGTIQHQLQGGGPYLPTSGGGLFSDDYDMVELHNTLITGNVETQNLSPDDVTGFPRTASSNNLISVGDYAVGLSNGVNGNQIGTSGSPIDAMIQPLADNGGPTLTHAVVTGSPAVDAGNDAEADNQLLLFDQRLDGYSRKFNTVDIGAYELDADLIFADGFEN